MIDIRVSDLLEAVGSVIESADEDLMASLGFFVRLRYWHDSVTHLGGRLGVGIAQANFDCNETISWGFGSKLGNNFVAS